VAMLLPRLRRTGGNLQRRPRHCPFHISLSLPCIEQKRQNQPPVSNAKSSLTISAKPVGVGGGDPASATVRLCGFFAPTAQVHLSKNFSG
jgi:hypothetical protein